MLYRRQYRSDTGRFLRIKLRKADQNLTLFFLEACCLVWEVQGTSLTRSPTLPVGPYSSPMDLCLETYGVPWGAGVSYERGTPVAVHMVTLLLLRDTLSSGRAFIREVELFLQKLG